MFETGSYLAKSVVLLISICSDTNHDNQTDIFFMIPRCFISFIGGKASRLDITVAHTTNLEICHAFLKRHLLKSEFKRALMKIKSCDFYQPPRDQFPTWMGLRITPNTSCLEPTWI